MKRDPASYLAAIIDGEGTVSCSRTNRSIIIYNTDHELILICEECLRQLSVGFCTYLNPSRDRGDKPCYRLVIGRRAEIEKLSELLPLAPAKQKRIDALVAMYRARIHTDEIVEWYRKGYTADEIAEGYKCSATLIYNRLRDAGEPIRVGGPRNTFPVEA